MQTLKHQSLGNGIEYEMLAIACLDKHENWKNEKEREEQQTRKNVFVPRKFNTMELSAIRSNVPTI